MKRCWIALASVLLAACGGSAPQEKKAEARTEAVPAPKDNTDKLLPLNHVSAKVVPNHVLGNSALPGGTVGDYEAKGQKYQVFIVETASPQDAAILLLDTKGTMKDPEYMAAFGGYFGSDANGELFVFAKSKYLAGVAGLPRAKADPIARQLAVHLN
ncbi:MAG TPA: hypothetical protein VG273_06770 [Bryobacteraceae bacterium]|jgi:hypothetical protein|nr:hypothetical protein [Bryobacteraceae bacterium]